MTAVAGQTLYLKCPVAGYPIEEIHWERGGRELPEDMRQKVQTDGTLEIKEVQKALDSGVYTCWARNKQGHSARRSGEVTVIGKGEKDVWGYSGLGFCLEPEDQWSRFCEAC